MKSCRKSGGCICNTQSHESCRNQAVVFATHELVLKIRRLVLTTHELTKSRTRAKIQVVVFATHEVTNSCWKSDGLCSTHELIKSRTCAKNQAVVFSTHELTKSRTRAENRAACVDNTRAHEVTNSCWKSDGLCWQRTNSRSHELVPKIGRLCFQHMRSRTRAENRATCVDNTRTHEVKLL